MRLIVTFVIFFVLLGGAHLYVWRRLVRDAALTRRWSRVGTGIVIALFASMTLAMLSPRAFGAILSREAVRPFAWVGYAWLGLLFFLVVALAITDLMRLAASVLRAARRASPSSEVAPSDPQRRVALARMFGGAAALLGVSATGVGVASVLAPVAVKRVRVVLDKLSVRASGYRIVQITDVHVGPTIGRGFVEDVVARINALRPDAVVITGDLVDGSVATLAEHVAPLGDLVARDGVFFVTGNHEYYSGAEAWVAHLGALGVRVLRNERVPLGGESGFDLAGIDDVSSGGAAHGHGPDLRKALADRDPRRACVLLAHQPKGVDLAQELGVDLQISGHTHGGQMVPWNLLVRLQQPFVAGLHRLAKAQIYVSRGTGYWGPPMRVGAPAEITEIELVAPGAPAATGAA